MHHALRAGGAVGGIALLTAFGVVASARAQDAQSCARPNVPTAVIHPAMPDMAPIAQQQGITGTVQVVVSLDPNSRVVGTRIQSSPSVVLNAAALSAARQSLFQTEIHNCVPIASDFILNVQFDSVQGSIATVSGGERPIAVVTGQGVATRPPDVAYVSAGIITSDDDAASATAKNVAIYTALRTQVTSLGVDDTAIRSAYFGVTFVGRPAPAPAVARSYVASRTVTATLVAGIQTIRVGENLLGPATPPPAFNPLFSQNGPAISSVNLHPAPVEVRANVTVTYVMKP